MDFVRLGDRLPAPMLGSHWGFVGCLAGASNVSGSRALIFGDQAVWCNCFRADG